MRNKNKKFLLLAILSILVIFGFSSSSMGHSTTPTNIVKAEDSGAKPIYTPSADPLKIFGTYWTSGYTLQPTSQYTYLNQKVTLNSNAYTTLFDNLSSIYSYSYQWYMSKDGINWGNPSDLKFANITLDASEVGTRYYQSTYTRGKLLSNNRSGYYSKMASVTVYPTPKDATSVSVSVDDDYLYNNQENAATTYAHATPDPYDSTAALSWSIDQTDLATIDKNSGLVTANTNGKSGTVKVTATMTNSDGSTVSGSKNITIGGGLDDQTVNEGKTATFKIQGNFDSTPDSITWHKIQNNKDTTIQNANDLSYTTPDTVYTDDKSQFYAVIKLTQTGSDGNPTTTTITTNKATLNVIPNTVPKVILNSNVYNNTFEDHNADDTELNNVVSGDKLTVRGTANDENPNSVMAAGAIKIKLPNNMTKDDNGHPVVNDVKVDGQATDDYFVSTMVGDDSTYYLTLFNLDFTKNKTHSYQFDFDVSGNDNFDFTTTPSLTGQDSAENAIDGTYEGNSLTIHFTDNKLSAQAHDVDYGTLKYSDVGKPQSGTIDGQTASDILSVTDKRRDKSPAKVYLSQTAQFTSNGTKLPSELRYYFGDGSYQTISDQATLLSDSVDGSAVNSVPNNTVQGLRLYIYNAPITYGSYSSTLDWTIEDTPD